MSHLKFPEIQFRFYFIQKTPPSFVTPLNGLQFGCGFAHHSRRCERSMQPCAHATCSKTSQTASKASPRKNCILQLWCTRCLTQNACWCSSACLQVHWRKTIAVVFTHFFLWRICRTPESTQEGVHSHNEWTPIHTTKSHYLARLSCRWRCDKKWLDFNFYCQSCVATGTWYV